MPPPINFDNLLLRREAFFLCISFVLAALSSAPATRLRSCRLGVRLILLANARTLFFLTLLRAVLFWSWRIFFLADRIIGICQNISTARHKLASRRRKLETASFKTLASWNIIYIMKNHAPSLKLNGMVLLVPALQDTRAYIHGSFSAGFYARTVRTWLRQLDNG